jgi:hypothetical protein
VASLLLQNAEFTTRSYARFNAKFGAKVIGLARRRKEMKERKRYKGHVIDARALPVRGGGWTSHFSIEKHFGDCVLDTRFETGQLFDTAQAALKEGIYLGARKIESGFVPTSIV